MLAGTGGDEGGTAERGTKPHPKPHPSPGPSPAQSTQLHDWDLGTNHGNRPVVA